jgi:hypothetical protein
VTVVKHSFRCKYKGNETVCSFKIVVCQKGTVAIFYMLAKYVPGDIKYIVTKCYRHISTNNEANRKFVILISNFFMDCDVLARYLHYEIEI